MSLLRAQRLEGSAAFTLVELLAVIAIVAVLAGLAIAGTSRIRATAAQARCLSNLRQMHGLIIAFATDNNGYLPSVEAKTASDRPSGAKENWWLEVIPYSSNYVAGSVAEGIRQIFRCDVHGANMRDAGATAYASTYMNYGMNWNLGFCAEASLNSRSRVRYLAIPEPTRTIMLSEAAYNSSSPIATLRNGNIRSSATFGGVYKGGTHDGANNILWADGHVAAWKDVARLVSAQAPGDPEPVSTYWKPGFP
jgi:prepilin-type processing-associated H-X9-DG protein/prepilin-type N-terminal cleavage/methylation domain-containing protein